MPARPLIHVYLGFQQTDCFLSSDSARLSNFNWAVEVLKHSNDKLSASFNVDSQLLASFTIDVGLVGVTKFDAVAQLSI